MHDRQLGRAGIAEHLDDAFVGSTRRKASRPVMVLVLDECVGHSFPPLRGREGSVPRAREMHRAAWQLEDHCRDAKSP